MAAKERTFLVGRGTECDIVLADDSVSRRHAEVVLVDGRLFLSDCRSANGTLLIDGGGARRISQEFVPLNTTVQFGDIRMSAAALLDALRARHPDLQVGARPSPAHDRPRTEWKRGSRLARCTCGAIRPKGSVCPECGQ